MGIGILTGSGEIAESLPLSTGIRAASIRSWLRALRGAARGGVAGKARAIDPAAIEWLPPLDLPPKISLHGLNYFAMPPKHSRHHLSSIFVRFEFCLIGHRALARPRESGAIDYEVEMVAIIGRAGRHISKSAGSRHVIGYSVFNDASIRDYQFKTPQWTQGKNFDGTGHSGRIL